MTSTQQRRMKSLIPKGVPKYVRCYDNGGETIDRYTVVFGGKYKSGHPKSWVYLGMSRGPYHSQGFCQHGEADYPIDRPDGEWAPALGRKCHLGKRIEFKELPAPCQRAVLEDYVVLWQLPTDLRLYRGK